MFAVATFLNVSYRSHHEDATNNVTVSSKALGRYARPTLRASPRSLRSLGCGAYGAVLPVPPLALSVRQGEAQTGWRTSMIDRCERSAVVQPCVRWRYCSGGLKGAARSRLRDRLCDPSRRGTLCVPSRDVAERPRPSGGFRRSRHIDVRVNVTQVSSFRNYGNRVPSKIPQTTFTNTPDFSRIRCRK